MRSEGLWPTNLSPYLVDKIPSTVSHTRRFLSFVFTRLTANGRKTNENCPYHARSPTKIQNLLRKSPTWLIPYKIYYGAKNPLKVGEIPYAWQHWYALTAARTKFWGISARWRGYTISGTILYYTKASASAQSGTILQDADTRYSTPTLPEHQGKKRLCAYADAEKREVYCRL